MSTEGKFVNRALHYLPYGLVVVLFALALTALHHTLEKYHYHDIIRVIKEMPHGQVALALLLTACSYIALTGYDYLAFRYIRQPLPYLKIGFASFIGYAFSNNVGFANLAGGSVRYRLYSLWGLSALDIAKVIVFVALTFWLGVFSLGGAVFILAPLPVPAGIRLSIPSVRPLGMVFLALAALYLLFSLARRKPLKVRGLEVFLPGPRFFLPQVAVSSLDWALAAGVLFSLLPEQNTLSYPMFIGIFLLAQTVGLISHVPGGIGVFETVILFFLSPILPASDILGTLIAYRAIYYLLPLSVAAMLMASHELRRHWAEVKYAAESFGQWVSLLIPHFLAATSFIGGMILLLSGAAPSEHGRMKWLFELMPLPVMELSHFLGSLAGLALLLLARGLQRRLDAAYFLTVGVMGAGVILSLLKGFDYEEAIALSIMMAALLPCRRHFHRRTSLLNDRFTPGWAAAIAVILLSSLWLGVFSNKHVDYSDDLWWRFSLHGDAPRFLRASVGITAMLIVVALARLMRLTSPKPEETGPANLEEARAILAQSHRTAANLALLGDKRLLFSENRSAFLMYAVSGRSWVALGDPVGPTDEHPDLLWSFRDLCDRYGSWPVFYHVSEENLSLYMDLGLVLLKLGEEARVCLDCFSLEGHERKDLRAVTRKFEKLGCQFEVLPISRVPEVLPVLRRISDEWLEAKHTREKGFSLGFFHEDYLSQFPLAVVRSGEEIIAFANVWLGGGQEELSLDLMRHVPSAPNGTMDYLFAQLMLWGKEEGYRWFHLGVAPLSGLENRALAPLWQRLGALVFQHGEYFYNFQGLRRYKEKFEPEWRPVYLACPGGLALPRILTSIAALISGGIKGVFAK